MNASQVFPLSEFEMRLARLQTRMSDAGLDGLLLTSEHDVRYVTGFLTRFWESPTRPWFVVVPASGNPIAAIPSIGAALMAATWVTDIRTWSAPTPEDDGISLLADTLKEVLPPHARLGLAMGHETALRMPLVDFMRLRDDLAPCEILDATKLLRETQAIKSERELEIISEICAIGGRAFDRIEEIVQVGKPLSGVYRDFQALLLSEGADWVPYVAGGAGQGGYPDVISPATDAPLRDGDILMLDTGAVRLGYFCDFDRNWSIGSASAETRSAYRLLFEATDAGFEAARPGTTASSVFRAMQSVIDKAGSSGAGGRLGHGLGMRLTEFPSLTATDETELQPGMVLTLEPGLEMAPGRMMVHEEDIVITDDGPRFLTNRAAPEIPEIGLQA
ncbi:M24 family metallopeptidase [Antarctobacter heliothermus]|uniref:Xaa-Pro aminopeptidase n=1 Tax=Antarctobacter heliothermus TaxID=74033 RepID=A0A239KWT4_9RHOB|nr:Xaa-Pro peptidase family protein [Antarctobacter heliothermus]SNT22837.1 Xaa-Pro aminopeptidase [Antarctobacter heliothermus]